MHTLDFFRRRCRIVAMAALLAVAGAGAGCVTEPSAITGERRSYGYSWEQEQQLGAQSDQQIVQEMGLYENEELQAYVDEVARRVLAQSDFADPDAPDIYRDTKFTFRVIDSSVVNAFALPGGYVYVTRGLLAHVQNEAQLAVVLGHEIAHVIARHASQQALRAQGAQLGLVAAAILGQEVLGQGGQDVASNILNIGGTALQLLMTRYSRDAERESDQLGVRYAGEAGYATATSAEFFGSLQRLSETSGRALPSWASTHPDPGERAQTVRELSKAWEPIGGADADRARRVGEAEFLRKIEGMVLGDDPREGYREGDTFYHPSLRFQFPIPSGWKMENQRAVVLLGEPSGQAMFGLELTPAASPSEAANQVVQQAGVQVVSGGETRINGLPAVVVIGQANTQQGALGVYNAFIEHGGKVYSLRGLAPAQVFSQVQPTFDSIARGFAPLRDERRLEVQPVRLQLVTTDRSAPFREFIPAVAEGRFTPEQLAILNQVTLDETVPAGRTLKLPR